MTNRQGIAPRPAWLSRRAILRAATATVLSARLTGANAAMTTPFRPGLAPPMTGREDFVRWMAANRGE
ncbi:MAG TPA: hypothetical protein VKU03_03625, partial [Roseiarcus sp.]|nr:hypothetical protein [Roseiarcus sp.]